MSLKRHFLTKTLTSLVLFTFFLAAMAADEGFPGRELYPQVKTISKEQLFERMNKDEVIVVDVRSEYEFQTLSILDSIYIPVDQKGFQEKLKKIRETSDKDIIFYCNGRTCYKSYKAGMKAIDAHVKNCLSYDAGIFEWTQQYPDKAVLLGQTPVQESSLISSADFKSRLLAPEVFAEKSLEDNTMILDVRDREQRRGGSGLFMFRDKNVTLDNKKKLDRLLKDAIDKDMTVFFYDEKGKQVRWLQYYLEKVGLKNYYFMKGGAAAYYKMISDEQQQKAAG